MNQDFIDIASCMDLALQILNYEQNTTQTSNDDIMKKIEEYIKENACYDEKIKQCKCSFSSMALDKILEIMNKEEI